MAVPSGATSTDTTPASPETSRPGVCTRDRWRNRFDVRLASRTGAPGGMASYDACNRTTASRCAAHPTTSLTGTTYRCSLLVGYSDRAEGEPAGPEPQEATEATTVPSGAARCTGTPAPARSRTTDRSCSSTTAASPSTTTASRPRAPLVTAIATASWTALSRRVGRSTVAAA